MNRTQLNVGALIKLSGNWQSSKASLRVSQSNSLSSSTVYSLLVHVVDVFTTDVEESPLDDLKICLQLAVILIITSFCMSRFDGCVKRRKRERTRVAFVAAALSKRRINTLYVEKLCGEAITFIWVLYRPILLAVQERK